MPQPPRPAPDSGTTGDLFDGMAEAGTADDPGFEPTPAAAQARLAAVRPAAYARTRNHLHGAVTRLSPYLTHGLLSLREVVTHLRRAHGLGLDHKLVQELGWRAWWHHAWRHQGEAIFDSLHEGPRPEAAYARELPADVRAACTGVPVIDQSVRTLCGSGYLHNHARMWLFCLRCMPCFSPARTTWSSLTATRSSAHRRTTTCGVWGWPPTWARACGPTTWMQVSQPGMSGGCSTRAWTLFSTLFGSFGSAETGTKRRVG